VPVNSCPVTMSRSFEMRLSVIRRARTESSRNDLTMNLSLSYTNGLTTISFLASRPTSAYHKGCVLEPLSLIVFS
jgi:hypothetical protein